MRILIFGILALILLVCAGFGGFYAYSYVKKGKNKQKIKRSVISFIVGFVALVGLFFIPLSIHQVETGEIAVIKKYGKAIDTKEAGLKFDLWFTTQYDIYDTKVQQIPIKTNAYSSDSQPMDIELYIQYQIQKENVLKIANNYGELSMLESRIETVSIERTKAILSSSKAEEVIKNRSEISPKVETEVRKAITQDYYVNIVAVVLTNIDFSDAFEKSVEDKMIAEQEKLKAQYENEKAKEKAEADLEVAMQEAKAILEKAKQEAEAEKQLADAESYALSKIQEVWESMSAEVREVMIQKLALEKWDGKMPETMVGNDFMQWLFKSLENGSSSGTTGGTGGSSSGEAGV